MSKLRLVSGQGMSSEMQISKYTIWGSWPRLLVIVAVLTSACSTVLGDLALETETARVLNPGQVEGGAAFEFQTAFDGQEYAFPGFVEFGVLPHLEVLIEPVAAVLIRPTSGGKAATSFGELETTVTGLILEERKYVPALAAGFEVKFPTSNNFAVGSGEYDYRIYGILSKRIGDVDVHLNLGYNIIGSPPGVATKNPLDFEVAAEWFVNPKIDIFAEYNRTNSSVGRSGHGMDFVPTVITAEVAPLTVVGSVGMRYHVNSHLKVFGSFSYDNSDAKLFRTGFSIEY